MNTKSIISTLLSISILPLISAETLTLTPSQDTDIYQFTTYPTSTTYSLGVNVSKNTGHSQQSLIQFALPTTLLPANLTTATLRLYVLENSATGSGFSGTLKPGLLSVYTQEKSWSPDTARWSSLASTAYLGDITIATPSTATTPIWVEHDVTAAVKSWLTGTANHGLLLQGTSETATAQLSVLFASMETGFPPQLVIQTAAPPPVVVIIPPIVVPTTPPTFRLNRKPPSITTRRSLILTGTTSPSARRIYYQLGRSPVQRQL